MVAELEGYVIVCHNKTALHEHAHQSIVMFEPEHYESDYTREVTR